MLSYNDTCRITRTTGDVDKYDNLRTVMVYEGACDFQPGGQTALSVITHSDVVYLPEQVMVKANDLIEVRTQWGRQRSGVVRLANDLGLGIDGSCVTEVEIKQSTEE